MEKETKIDEELREDSAKSASPPKVDQIISVIGETGRWQLRGIAIVFFISVPGLAHIFVAPFSMPKTDFWCYDEETHTNSSKNDCSSSCGKYLHDLESWQQTVITEYDLVCERSYMPTLAKILFFGGFGIGTFVSGIISDAFGRKKALIIFSLMIFVSGIACSFMPNFPAYLVTWIVVGIAAVANFTVAFVWVMEVASGKWKILLGMGMQFTWPVSRMFVLICAWLTKNWRRIMQLISAPMLVAPIFLFLLPESPRWLVARGRISDAKAVIGKAVEVNKLDVNMDEVVLNKPNQTARKGTVLDILRYSVLRKKTLIMYVNWFSSSFMMYGLNLNWQNLTGNLWLTFLIATCLDFPAKGFSVVSLLFYGRKMPYVGLTFIGGIFFLAILCLRGVFENELPIIILSMIASFCVSSSFGMLWMWTSELMPTTVRNAGVGSSSMVARIGGVMATTVGKLADISPQIPIAMFTFTAFLSASLSLLLPETQGKRLPDTPEESEEDPLLSPKEGLLTMFAHVRTRRAE